MRELDSKKSALTASNKVCVVLPLSSPDNSGSIADWYLKKICGIPFLIRNILNIQRAGIDSLIIYSGTENTSLYKRLCDEKKITAKLTFETNIRKIKQATENHPTLILNGEALYTKQEIESGMIFTKQCDKSLAHPIDRENMTETISQMSLGKKISFAQSSDYHESRINFLPGKIDSQITKPGDFFIQHEKLLRNSGLGNDSFMDKTITRFFSRQLTRLFLKTPLSPNAITILSLLIGLISAAFFLQGDYKNNILGAGLLLFSAWIDCTDGEVARLKFSESKIGSKLDIICDNLVHFAVFFSIGMGLYQSAGKKYFLFLGTLAVFGSLVSFLILSLSIINQKEMASANTAYSKNKLTDKLANRDFIYFLFFMSLLGRVDIFICLAAFGANIFAAYLTFSKVKSALRSK